MDRRKFVKSTAAIGGAGLLLEGLPLQALGHHSVADEIK